MTIIIHLFTPTAIFFTARTTEVFRVAQIKATGSHFQLRATYGLTAKSVFILYRNFVQQAFIMGFVSVEGAIGLRDARGCLRLKK
jgi:hypothetical protein